MSHPIFQASLSQLNINHSINRRPKASNQACRHGRPILVWMHLDDLRLQPQRFPIYSSKFQTWWQGWAWVPELGTSNQTMNLLATNKIVSRSWWLSPSFYSTCCCSLYGDENLGHAVADGRLCLDSSTIPALESCTSTIAAGAFPVPPRFRRRADRRPPPRPSGRQSSFSVLDLCPSEQPVKYSLRIEIFITFYFFL